MKAGSTSAACQYAQLKPITLLASLSSKDSSNLIPIPSMYGIFAYIWLFLMGNYGKCR